MTYLRSSGSRPWRRQIGEILGFCAFAVMLVGCRSQGKKASASIAEAAGFEKLPRLAVMIVIDQMRGDDILRFDSLFRDGMRQLLDEGSVYVDAWHEHGVTETGSGHATLGTGVLPEVHGVVSKRYYDQTLGKRVHVCSINPAGCSADSLLVQTLGARLKAQYAGAKVVAMAQKARSANLLAGHEAAPVIWFNDDGGLSARWGREHRRSERLDLLFEQVAGLDRISREWALPVLPDQFQALEDDREGESLIFGDRAFPHVLEGDDPQKIRQIWAFTPDYDRAMVEIALDVARHEGLGQDETPDLLLLGLSATDLIGHSFGPFSLEKAAHMVDLDRHLGDLLEGLRELAGDELLVVLSSDHGVIPLPEHSRAQGKNAARLDHKPMPELLTRVLEARFANRKHHVAYMPPFITLPTLSDEERAQVMPELLEVVAAQPGVYRAVPTHELAKSKDPALRSLAKSVYPGRSGHIAVLVDEGSYVWSGFDTGTRHGMPWRDDRHVPLLVWRPAGQGQRFEQRVDAKDATRTLGAALGLPAWPHSGKVLHIPARGEGSALATTP